MEDEGIRWNIKVSKETDLSLRTYLGSQGMSFARRFNQGPARQLRHK